MDVDPFPPELSNRSERSKLLRVGSGCVAPLTLVVVTTNLTVFVDAKLPLNFLFP